MYRNRQYRQQNYGIYLLAYQLMNTNNIPPVTLLTIIFQIAVFLGFVPPISPAKTGDMCLLPTGVIRRREWLRMLASFVMHANDMHLYYNMISFLWKGRRLERHFGSWRFLLVILVFGIATSSTMVGLSYLADHILELKGLNLMNQCAVGFSGVLFALKVLHNSYFPYEDEMLLGWLPIPSRYSCWAELIIIQMITPNASFVGHFAGILVGLLYTLGPLKAVVDVIESFLPFSFGLQAETPARNTNSRENGPFFGGGRFRNWGSGTPGSRPNGDFANHRQNVLNDYDEYTGGMSEEEQMRRATEESLRYRDRPNPNAPPYPEYSHYGWR